MSTAYGLLCLVMCFSALAATAQTLLKPQSDDEIIEVLPSVTGKRPPRMAQKEALANPFDAAKAAQQAIATARKTGDNRFWGRAQAVLMPWWDKPDAPVDLAVLQATVQQGRHEFAAAHQVLEAAVKRQPGHAQGWLSLAALERLLGNYRQSLAACRRVAQAGQAFYSQACALENHSLQGQNASVSIELARLVGQVSAPEQHSWLLSLLAENQERAGQDRIAAETYQRSLTRQSDLYTAVAFADLLLRTGKSAQALRVLADYPDTDSVLLRRAIGFRRLGDPRWLGSRAEFQQRVADLKRRGDDIELHGRESAMSALWLDDDPKTALRLARQNLTLQKEPVDWLVARYAAWRARDLQALSELQAEWEKTGLIDVRLNAALKPEPTPANPRAGS